MPINEQTDLRIYGAQPLADRPALDGTAQPYVPPTNVPEAAALKGTALLAQGEANLRANQREEANYLASAGAAMTRWSPVTLHEWATAPYFKADRNFNAADFARNAVDFRMDSEDEKFMLKAVSAEDAQYRLNSLQERNMAYQAMGDHGTASFLAGALDPGYLAIDVASMGVGRVARVGFGLGTGASRAAAAATAAGVTAGMELARSEAEPVSTGQIVANALLNGAATAAFFRAGKMHPVDPDFPTAELHEVARRVQEASTPPVQLAEVPHVTPLRREPAGAVDVPLNPTSRVEPALARNVALDSLDLPAKVKAGLQAEGKVLTVYAPEDIAQHTQTGVRVAPDAKAVYIPEEGKVFLITRNLDAGDDVRGIMLHEYGVHMSGPSVLGTEKFDKLLGSLQELAEGGSARARAAFEDVPVDTPAALRAEEALGYYVERNHEVIGDTLINRLKAGVRQTLRDSGLAPLKFSENDIMQMVRYAAQNGSGVSGAGTLSPGVRYSKGLRRVGTAAQEAVRTVRSSEGFAQAISWSWHKTMGAFSPKAKEIADIFLDDPLGGSVNSAAGIQRAVRADLAAVQYLYEDALKATLAKRGAGIWQRITNTTKAAKQQQALEGEVYAEMARRNRAVRDGKPLTYTNVDPDIKLMADHLDALSAASLKEMQAAGVKGAEDLSAAAGYITRKWDVAKIEGIERKLLAQGPMAKGALRTSFTDTIGIGIQRATGWDAELAQDVAGAIYDRAKRKGEFNDSAFHIPQGKDAAAEVRDLLTNTGLSDARKQRILDVLVGKSDEAGKLNTLKARIDIALDEPMNLPDGTQVTIMDMLDTNVSALTERYLDTVSSRVAFAKKGLPDNSDLVKLRTELAQSIPELGKREEALKSYDQMLNALQGLPVGEDMLRTLRNTQALTQMVGLAASGLWQATEYAPIMAHYGGLATMKSMLKELPFVRGMVQEEASHLKEVLARNSAQDTRLRPFITRMEDNFEVPLSDSVTLSLQQAKQLVPYANAMKFIQHHQARTTANLVVDTIVRAAKGDAKAAASLSSYGLESHSMMQVSADIAQHGLDTARWSNGTWEAIRTPLTKMMDDAVLRARTGEIPQFAQTSTVGKFLFTFRNFTLTAHNKVLAGTLNRHGYSGLGLVLMYQIPMTVLATAANNTIQGRKAQSLEDTTKAALSQVGAFGLFSEALGVITGNKQQFGSPGLIFVDRVYKAAGALASGSPGNTASALLNATPILSSILPMKAVGEALKEDKDK